MYFSTCITITSSKKTSTKQCFQIADLSQNFPNTINEKFCSNNSKSKDCSKLYHFFKMALGRGIPCTPGLRGLCPHCPQQGASPPAPPIAPRPKGSEGRACPSLHNSVFGIQLLARVSRAGKPALANASCLTAVHRQTCGLPQGLFCGGSVSDNPPSDRLPRKWLPWQPSLVKLRCRV